MSRRLNTLIPLVRLAALAGLAISLDGCSGGEQMQVWHTDRLAEEFTADDAEEITSFGDYLELEERLFAELQNRVYAATETGPEYKLDRFSSGSAADPTSYDPNWNRSFELTADNPAGGILLLHGMSDSPYSLRQLGLALNRRGYHVVGMRMPGHGTAPSGLRFIDSDDLMAAVNIGMRHLNDIVGAAGVHIIGYSVGATLAINFSLDALEGKSAPVPDSLILVSPAIGVSSAAGFARFKNAFSRLPGLSNLAFLQIHPEFDPYKYNSFATNAASVSHKLTRAASKRVAARTKTHPDNVLPPVLVFKSTVDATVTTEAVADRLLEQLAPDKHEIVLFDINRYASVKARLLVDDPAPLTDRLIDDDQLPFTVTLVTNESSATTEVVRWKKLPYSGEPEDPEPLDLSWPPGVISLSHVALPFAPSDPLYGQRAPDNQEFLYLGQMNLQGERGVLKIPTDWIFRLRHNPFYGYLEGRTLDWVDNF